MERMAPRGMNTALASSFGPLPLPFWLTSTSKPNSKVRLHGVLDAIYLEHSRLVVQAGEDDLIWVFVDKDTRFVNVTPEQLVVGQKVQVDGVLQANRLGATRLRLLH